MSNSASIDFLGGTQTLVGVLATLVILCMFNQQSNFTLPILKEIRKKVKRKLKALKITADTDKIANSSDYKWLESYLEESSDKELCDEGSVHMYKIKQLLSRAPFVSIPIDNHLKTLRKYSISREQLVAPMFTFLFCLIIFMYDELLRTNAVVYNDLLISSLSLFVAYSYIMWILIWGQYVIRISTIDFSGLGGRNNSNLNRIATGHNIMLKDKNVRCAPYIFLCRQLVCLIILIGAFFLGISYECGWWIIVTALLFPVIGVGSLRLISFRSDEWQYTYNSTCGHIVALWILAVCNTIILFMFIEFFGQRSSHLLMPYENCRLIKAFTLAFIVLNGILLPYVMPYYAYNRIYSKARSDLRKKNEDLETDINKSIGALKEFHNKVNKKGTGLSR